MLEATIRPRALLDIDSIQIHLMSCTGSTQSAHRFIEDIYSAIEKLCEFPDMGHVSPYLPEGSPREYRRFLMGTLYWIYYAHNDTTLTVWRVIHAKQEIDDYMLVEI